MFIMNLLRLVDRIFSPNVAFAHCDIPCGIYDPKSAQLAAETVAKMVEKLLNPPPLDENDKQSRLDFHNNMTRYVIEKEEQAQICKKELLILWTDFFKPEHLEMFPNLHETFWKATKLCSKNKQSVDEKAAKDLVDACAEIAEMFAKAKAAAKKQ